MWDNCYNAPLSHQKIRRAARARECISLLLSLFEIAPVNKTALERALNLPFKDFEDAVLHESARLVNADRLSHAIRPILNTRISPFGCLGKFKRVIWTSRIDHRTIFPLAGQACAGRTSSHHLRRGGL